MVEIDELHLADDDLARFIAELCDRWPAPHRLVLAGRRLPEPVRRSLVGTDSVLIGSDDLRFDPQETRELLGHAVTRVLDDADVARIAQRCEGWAAAVGLAGARLQLAASHGDAEVQRAATEFARRPSTVQDTLRTLLAQETVERCAAIAQLSLLPVLDDELVCTAGVTGGIAELADIGLPLDEVSSGTWAFPSAIREALRPPLRDAYLTRAAAERYIELRLPHEAFDVLQSAGLEDDLAELLAGLPPSLVDAVDATELASAVEWVPHRLLVANPCILLYLADAYTLSGRAEAYADTVRRAVELIAERAPVDAELDPDALEVRASDLTMRAIARNDDSLVAEVRRLLARPDLPAMARARLSAAAGRAAASRRTASALSQGARELEDAARAFQREGASVHAFAVRVIAATYTSIPLGRYEMALEQFDQTLAAAPGNLNVRVATLPYRAFVLIDLGRYAEAEAVLTELRQTATTTGLVGNERSAAFARWAAARMASQRGDAETAWAACRAVERSEVPVDTGNGAFFRADAAQLLARVSWFDESERLLGDARERDPGNSDLVTVAEFAVAAHLGDLARAEAMLDRLDGGRVVEPRDRWRVTLLHAYVCHRNDDSRAPALAAAAFEEAAQLGYPDLPLVQEPQAARELLPFAGRGSASARDVARASGVRIRLFGGISIERAGHKTELSGRPGQLIAYLALHDRQATVDQAIEALWPECEPTRGRERLRTVLGRVRRDHEDLIERHDGLLRLGEQVTIDVEDFFGFCEQVATHRGAREKAARAALALYRRELAPSFGHFEWVASLQRHLENRALEMHDAVADETTADGRVDDAIRSLFAALALDPTAEHRYVTAARLLAEQGRRARALQLLGEARAELTVAGLAASVELDRLHGYLARNPAVDTAQAS